MDEKDLESTSDGRKDRYNSRDSKEQRERKSSKTKEII